jgi:L-threonylcarbamoyladenylate synthase
VALIDIPRAIAGLQAGRVVAVPTETVYGLAGRIDREETLRLIFSTKQRPFFDPLIVHVQDVEQARSLASEWPEIYNDLAETFWPGPLTLIAPKTTAVSDLITSGLTTVGLRCPRHPVALELLRALKVPYAAPSANRFGRTSPTTAQDVLAEFEGDVEVVDGGRSEVGIESTVLQAERTGGTWRLHILRPGGVSRQQLRAALEPKYQIEIVRSRSKASPGHLQLHYQPSNPVVITEVPLADPELAVSSALGNPVAEVHHLKLNSAPEQAARDLYAEFRRLSHGPGAILVERTSANSGEAWEAVWDRIERAASATIK